MAVKFTSYKAKVMRKIEKGLDTGMELVALQGESNAIAEVTRLVYDTPPSPTYVRTGDLRKSITHKYIPEERTAYIGTAIEYAPYVEFGTSKMEPRPFLENAAFNYSDEYAAILKDALSKI